VCDKLCPVFKSCYDEKLSTSENEKKLFELLCKQAWDKMTTEERLQFEKSISKFMANRWGIGEIWTINDIADAAYRVTVPCVIEIGQLRIKHSVKENKIVIICPKQQERVCLQVIGLIFPIIVRTIPWRRNTCLMMGLWKFFEESGDNAIKTEAEKHIQDAGTVVFMFNANKILQEDADEIEAIKGFGRGLKDRKNERRKIIAIGSHLDEINNFSRQKIDSLPSIRELTSNLKEHGNFFGFVYGSLIEDSEKIKVLKQVQSELNK
jgi:hypothetical protein